MKWRRGKRSPDLRDQRAGGGGGGIPGRGGGFPIPTGRMGGGGLIGFIIIVILFFVLRGGGGGAGFDIPDPTAGFPQAPASGKGDKVSTRTTGHKASSTISTATCSTGATSLLPKTART